MSLTTRKSPFKWMSVFDDMDELFSHRGNRMMMPVDIIEDENNYIIKANLPGISKNDISIEINHSERYLDLDVHQSDENTTEKKENGVTYHRRERYTGSLSRRFRFGNSISTENATTQLKDGILTIKVPKTENSKTVKLNVR